jgi:hypothetical protein
MLIAGCGNPTFLRGRVRIWEDRIVWGDQVRVRVED